MSTPGSDSQLTITVPPALADLLTNDRYALARVDLDTHSIIIHDRRDNRFDSHAAHLADDITVVVEHAAPLGDRAREQIYLTTFPCPTCDAGHRPQYSGMWEDTGGWHEARFCWTCKNQRTVTLADLAQRADAQMSSEVACTVAEDAKDQLHTRLTDVQRALLAAQLQIDGQASIWIGRSRFDQVAGATYAEVLTLVLQNLVNRAYVLDHLQHCAAHLAEQLHAAKTAYHREAGTYTHEGFAAWLNRSQSDLVVQIVEAVLDGVELLHRPRA